MEGGRSFLLKQDVCARRVEEEAGLHNISVSGSCGFLQGSARIDVSAARQNGYSVIAAFPNDWPSARNTSETLTFGATQPIPSARHDRKMRVGAYLVLMPMLFGD